MITAILITLPLDQLVGILGFMLLEHNGIQIDHDFFIGRRNNFNPIKRLFNGDVIGCIESIIIWNFFILAILHTIAASSVYPLF